VARFGGGGGGRRARYHRAVPLLECVPNVAEGRRPVVVARLAAAVARPGVRVLDVGSDPDHHRSVLTLAGEPEALEAGLLALFAEALAAIDLRAHEGVHPRVGAVDVVPFVPLGETPMAVAVAAARSLGAAVAARFDLPVLLYEEAASRPERRLLPDLRRGGLAGLGARLADPAGRPDFGPPRLHPTAGAAIVGARSFLIAVNALLDTAEVAVAGAVARAVRESSGGLPAVRALGLLLARRGRAQVSLNLVDYRRTSLAAAMDAVAAEAARHGARVVETELVGLLPEAAARGAEGLGIAGLAERVLERRLAAC
jgi:glutamate formiminotransferase